MPSRCSGSRLTAYSQSIGEIKDAIGTNTSGPLPTAQTHAEIADDMAYVTSTVCESVGAQEARADPAGNTLNGRWEFANNGDVQDPGVRARYVACENNTRDDLQFSAAAPPLE